LRGGLGVEPGVLADASDQRGVRRKVTEHLFIGVTAVDHHAQGRRRPVVFYCSLLLKSLEGLHGNGVQVALLHLLFVNAHRFGRCRFARLARGGGVFEPKFRS